MKAMEWSSGEGQQTHSAGSATQTGLRLVLLWCLIGLAAGLLAALTPRDAATIDATVIGCAGDPSAAPAQHA